MALFAESDDETLSYEPENQPRLTTRVTRPKERNFPNQNSGISLAVVQMRFRSTFIIAAFSAGDHPENNPINQYT